MRRFQMAMGGAVCVALLFAATVHAGETPDPLRFVPKKAELVAKIENPKNLAESLYYLDVVQKAMEIDAVHEVYNSTNAKRFYQLISYFERKLNQDRFELLDQLAGGGAVLAVKINKQPTVLAILQGKNEKLLDQFVKTSLTVVQHELDRQQIKANPKQNTYRGVTVYGLDNKAIFGVAGSALLFSNRPEGMKAAIDLFRDGDDQSVLHSEMFLKAKAELQASKPAGWAWLNLDAVRMIPNVKQVLKTIEVDPVQTFLFGGIANTLKRAPYLTAAMHHSENQLRATIRMPAGRDGMLKKLSYFVPKKGGVLPPLTPKNALLSSSFYLDWNKVWEHRKEVLPDDIAKGLEQLERQAGVVLGGTKFSELLAQAGTQQRVVVAYTKPLKYTTKPKTSIPSFAMTFNMRDPQFAKHMNGIIRGAAFIGALQFKLKIVEKKYKGQNLVTYYFPENTTVKGDPNNVRYNFSPSFATVGNQFMVSSTAELATAMIDDLVHRSNEKESATVSNQTRMFASGGAAYLRTQKDQFLSAFILGQGLSPSEANKQFEAMMAVARGLGVLQVQVDYGPNQFEYDVRLDLDTKK